MGDLRVEVEILREENRQLRDCLLSALEFDPHLCLSPIHKNMLRCLLSHDAVSTEMMISAITTPYCEATRFTVQASIFRLRAKMRQLGLRIETMQNFGYRIPQRKIWREKLSGGSGFKAEKTVIKAEKP